jgi:hypothetical protein
MTSWLDDVAKHGRQKTREKVSKLTPTWFAITVRRPTDNDPGQIAEGWYVLSADLVVTLTDQDGKPLEDVESATVTDPKYAAAAAARLLRDHRAGKSDFNRRLRYRRLGIY